MTKLIISALRAINGLALAFGILLSAGFLISVLRDSQTKPILRTFAYVTLYAVGLFVQLFIARCIWRSSECSFKTVVIAFGVWVACFVWHGWFTEWAPYRLHEVLIPSDAEAVYKRIYFSAAAWLLCYALFPILWYVDHKKGLRVRNGA